MSLIREYVRQQLGLLQEDKRGRVKAMGFPAEFADMLHNFYPPWTHKYADWMARELLKTEWWDRFVSEYKSMSRAPEDAVVSREYDPRKELEKAFLRRWETEKKNKVGTKEKFAAIFQWMDSKGGGPKLNKLSADEAYEKAWLLPELQKSVDEGEIMVEFEDGWKWANLQVSYCEPEAVSMGHCADDSSGDLWSLRDPKGYPHVTCTVDEDGVVTQMKGRNNSVPKSEYHPYIVQLLSNENITGIKTEKDADFHLSDLTEEQREKIQEANPSFEIDEQYSTVELLREGDPERLKEEGVFAMSVELLPDHAVFPIWPSEVADLYRSDDDAASQRTVGFLFNGTDWEDIDYIRENFDEKLRYDDDIVDSLSEESKDMMMDAFRLQNPDYAEEHEEEWENLDFDYMWDDIKEAEDIISVFKDAWSEEYQRATTAAAIQVALEAPVKQKIVDGLTIDMDAGQSELITAKRGRLLMTMSYERLADLVDIHHPGTPMDGGDVTTMIREIADGLYGNEDHLASFSHDDVYGEELDEEEMNRMLQQNLGRTIKKWQAMRDDELKKKKYLRDVRAGVAWKRGKGASPPGPGTDA